MIRRIPVVSTNVGGLAEVVGKNGEAGFSIQPNDVLKFANAIISLFEDNKLRSSIIEKGYKRVNEKFTIERMAEEYKETIYRNHISKGKAG